MDIETTLVKQLFTGLKASKVVQATMLQCSKVLQSLEKRKEVFAKPYLRGERWSFQVHKRN